MLSAVRVCEGEAQLGVEAQGSLPRKGDTRR